MKRLLNVLISPVGYKDEKTPVTDNVTDVIDKRYVPTGQVDEYGKEIYRYVKPNLVYLILTKESISNAKLIRERYKDDKETKVILVPDEENGRRGEYVDKYNFKGIKDKLINLKEEIDSQYPDHDITYYLNITPGTKIMTAAFASMSMYFDAEMWYSKEKSTLKNNEADYELLKPPTHFDPSKLRGSRRDKTLLILKELKEGGPQTRTDLTKIGLSGQTISYNVRLLIADGFISEDDPLKRKLSLIRITPSGATILDLLESSKAKKPSCGGMTAKTGSKELRPKETGPIIMSDAKRGNKKNQ